MEGKSPMSQDQDQRDRLQRLRAARYQSGRRVELYTPDQPITPGAAPIYAPTRGRSGRGGALFALLVILIFAVGLISGGGYVLHQFHTSVGGPRRNVRFVVPTGA